MGLPGFNSWFSKQHPEAFVSYQRGSFEHVYIDLAGVLHTVLRKAHSERKFHKLLYQRLNEILDRTSPLKSVVFALDGPAPLAKLVTQRRRRQRDDRKEVRDGGQPSQISSLGLTPGTPLMLTIQKSLEVYICSQLQCHRWRNVQFELSGATVVGEGELKIMSRLLCPWAEVEEGDKHLIVGSDSDLILMSLISPADNIYLLMERPDGTNRFMCFAKAVLLRSWSGRLVPKGLTHQAAAQYLDGVARDLAVLSIMGRSNDYLPPVRGAMLEDTGPQKGMWTVYKRMRKQPQWAHQNLIPQQGGKLQLNGAFIAAVLRTQSSQTRTSAPPLVFLQPPDPIEYAQGLVWVVEMYSEAKCLNYRWMHDRAGPWAATMAAALSHAPEFNTPDGPHPALSHAEPTTSSHVQNRGSADAAANGSFDLVAASDSLPAGTGRRPVRARQAAEAASRPAAAASSSTGSAAMHGQSSSTTVADGHAPQHAQNGACEGAVPPLLPVACAMALLPASTGRHHAPAPLRHLMDPDSPIADVYAVCPECDDAAIRVSLAQRRYMEARSAFTTALQNGKAAHKARKTATAAAATAASSTGPEAFPGIAASGASASPAAVHPEGDDAVGGPAVTSRQGGETMADVAGATATAEVDLDADPDLDSDGESGAGSEDSEDLLASATGQLLDADGESSAAESHGCVVRELLARAKELDRAMQAEKVHLKREIQAKEWHEQESHSYVPFPVERLEAAVAAVPLDAYPPAQRVLAEFGRSHRFRSVAVTKAAAGAGMEHSPQTGLSLQKPWPRHPLGRSQYKDHSHHICREALVEGPDGLVFHQEPLEKESQWLIAPGAQRSRRSAPSKPRMMPQLRRKHRLGASHSSQPEISSDGSGAKDRLAEGFSRNGSGGIGDGSPGQATEADSGSSGGRGHVDDIAARTGGDNSQQPPSKPSVVGPPQRKRRLVGRHSSKRVTIGHKLPSSPCADGSAANGLASGNWEASSRRGISGADGSSIRQSSGVASMCNDTRLSSGSSRATCPNGSNASSSSNGAAMQGAVLGRPGRRRQPMQSAANRQAALQHRTGLQPCQPGAKKASQLQAAYPRWLQGQRAQHGRREGLPQMLPSSQHSLGVNQGGLITAQRWRLKSMRGRHGVEQPICSSPMSAVSMLRCWRGCAWQPCISVF